MSNMSINLKKVRDTSLEILFSLQTPVPFLNVGKTTIAH